jgi:metal-responsive CopG/Arc/MetJ family transcriptional regulator
MIWDSYPLKMLCIFDLQNDFLEVILLWQYKCFSIKSCLKNIVVESESVRIQSLRADFILKKVLTIYTNTVGTSPLSLQSVHFINELR